VLQGTVIAMDLASLQLQVGDVVHTIAATRYRSCKFEALPDPATAGEEATAVATPEMASAVGPDAGQSAGTGKAEAGRPTPRVSWSGPLPDPVDPAEAEVLPHDLRGRSRLRGRLEALDEAYPWLAPTEPSQWFSLGLLLAVSLSLVVHFSVGIAGAESASLGRSSGLAAWYLLTALLQFAIVPIHDFAVVLMLLSNTTVSLFWLCALFGLSRGGAMVAFLIQLGFGLLGFGVLELVTALLGSIGTTA
jgi:hypothetical protein